jgi:hypothetical protein
MRAQLDAWGVTAEDACSAVRGSTLTPEDLEAWEESDWEWRPVDMPGLWGLYGERHAVLGDVTTGPHLVAFRAGGDLRRDAERLLGLGDRARLLLAEGEAAALLLSEVELQRLQRYEGHLERVLYRALHELEAMRERRLGRQAPLARLEVNGLEEGRC